MFSTLRSMHVPNFKKKQNQFVGRWAQKYEAKSLLHIESIMND